MEKNKKNERERDGTRSERKGDKKLVEGNCVQDTVAREGGGWV